MHTQNSFLPRKQKYLFQLFSSFLFWTLILNNFTFASSLPSIIPDYTALSRTQIFFGTPQVDKAEELLNQLNEQTNCIEDLYKYFSGIKSMDEITTLSKVGEKLLNVPADKYDKKGGCLSFCNEIIEERAFHILNFVYLTKPNISPWLKYHYALSILAFPQLAAERFDNKEPVEFALEIFCQWNEHMLSDIYAQEIHFGNSQDVPMNRINLSRLKDKYEASYARFYCLLSFQTIFYSLEAERHPKDTPTQEYEEKKERIKQLRNQMLKGLQKYNMENPNKATSRESVDPWKWLDGPCYFALGAAATAALTLASNSVGQPLHH